MSLECSSKILFLEKRAEYLRKVREFFFERSVLEVDTPVLCQFPPIDSAIEVMEVDTSPGEIRYLHTSPEYGMKRLLAEGIGDIYQLSHVFRKKEVGSFHNPEFTMCEWYRMGTSMETLIEEVILFIELFIGHQKHQVLTYKEALQSYFQIDGESPLDKLQQVAKERGAFSLLDREEILDFLYSELEKNLPPDELVIIIDFPPSKAALSEVCRSQDGRFVARRFEIFYRGSEIANGYQELTDPIQQKKRLEEEAEKYLSRHGKKMPIDSLFMEALSKGIPPCSGVACGFDRLVMLGIGATSLSSILPWSWQEA